MAELQSPSDVLNDSPAALIRGMDGLIAFWSPVMEQRYGFAAEEAVGQVSHRLLRTSSWQDIGEIEAVLIDRNVWHGGLIHHRADGQPVMSANHWHLHRQTNDQGMLVTELHSDIVATDTDAGHQLADVMTTIAQDLSQPLTALGSYISGMRRGFEPAWSDKLRLEQGMTEAAAQLARTSEALNRLRSLGENLRDPRLRGPHARMTAAFAQAERIVQVSREATRETKNDPNGERFSTAGKREGRAPSSLICGNWRGTSAACGCSAKHPPLPAATSARCERQSGHSCRADAEAVSGPREREIGVSRSARGG